MRTLYVVRIARIEPAYFFAIMLALPLAFLLHSKLQLPARLWLLRGFGIA